MYFTKQLVYSNKIIIYKKQEKYSLFLKKLIEMYTFILT